VNEKRLLPEYLGWMCRTRGFVEECQRASEGTTNRVRLQEERFLAMDIPLPPLAEQQRVVARIDELDGKIQEALELRKSAEEGVEALFYSSLRQARLRLLNASHPKNRLGSLTKVTSGGTPSRDDPTFWQGSIPWVKTGELLDGDISNTAEHITDAAVKNSSAKIFPRQTVLIALYGQGQTRGRTGRLLIEAATNQACCAVFPNPAMFDPRYVQFWLRSLYVELREESQGGAQPNWNGAMIKNLEIALPALAEQHEVVAELDDLQAQVESLRRVQAETAAELDALLPSILDRAFRGELYSGRKKCR
jgi:type I restriction enzyme S subunit